MKFSAALRGNFPYTAKVVKIVVKAKSFMIAREKITTAVMAKSSRKVYQVLTRMLLSNIKLE